MTSPSGPPSPLSSIVPRPSQAGKERSTLSRELSEFLIELSIALHKHAMYPEGHPSLQPAAEGVVRRAARLFQDRPTVSLGVASNQLIIEGVATDPKHPVLAELAGRLHRHHLGAMTFSAGTDVDEVRSVLRTLAVEADRSGQPLGLGDPERLDAWRHIRLHAMTYDRLELMNELEGKGTPPPDLEEENRAERIRGSSLWIGLARAALAGQLADDQELPTKPSVIAKAIDEHSSGDAYDQVIVGYLLQIAEELKAAGGVEGVELKRRTSRLIRALRPETLQRLVDMGGDASQRRRFVLDSSLGMSVEAVLEIVRAAAAAGGQSVSHSMFRMLNKLAAHAEQGTVHSRPAADAALREQVRTMMADWELADPNPSAYGEALQRLSQAGPIFAAPAESMHATEPERLIQMSLEADAVGPKVWEACAALMDFGRLGQVLDLIESAPPGTHAAEDLTARTVSVGSLHYLLTLEPVDFGTVDRLLARLGPEVADPLLDTLAASESRTTRRGVIDRLKKLGPALGPYIAPRLSDERWYVKRNLLALLDDLPDLPPGVSALARLADDDARVRFEALKIALKSSTERDQAMHQALVDQDTRLVRLALVAALQGVSPAVVSRIIAIANNPRIPQDLRLQAIRALGASRAPHALQVLLAMTDGGRTLFGRPKLRAKSPELLAALSALSLGFGSEPRAMAILARAALSKDPEIREATDPGTVAG